MISLLSNLSDELETELTKAEEIWIAVGLLNSFGLQFILGAVPKSCKINIIAGIDLPTDPKALSKLLSLKGKRIINAKVFTEEYFHPKVYVIKSASQLFAIVGSANCTMGGLEDNVEMSIGIKDNAICKSLIQWIVQDIVPTSQPLTADFIKAYKPAYDKRMMRKKKEKVEIEDLKDREQIKARANLVASVKLISALKRVRKSKDYKQIVKDRQRTIRELRKSLDYPYFKDLDLKSFFAIKQLGTIVPIRVKSRILDDRKKFTALMKFICNEKIPIKQRIDEAINGSLSIENIGGGFISKVLVAHDSKKYYLHNKIFTEKLRPFGLELPRGLSFGEKYELTRNILQSILKETDIDDFATFDQFIWST